MKAPAHSVALFTVLAACNAANSPRDQKVDTYTIYGAAIDSFAVGTGSKFTIAASTHPTALTPRLAGIADGLLSNVVADTGIGPELVGAFDAANVAPVPLCDCFGPGRSVMLVPHRLQPGVASPILLSGVGYNSTGTRALVEISQVCGPLCGSSVLYLMVRQNRGWVVSRRILSGAS